MAGIRKGSTTFKQTQRTENVYYERVDQWPKVGMQSVFSPIPRTSLLLLFSFRHITFVCLFCVEWALFQNLFRK